MKTKKNLVRRIVAVTAACLGALTIAGCAGPQPSDYAATRPVFDLRQYFNGTVLAYGPTKAALQHLADALFLDLRPLGIGVSVVNPGFVSTPLTAGNDFEMPALLTPQQAASHIVRGWGKGRFEIDFPKRFSLWMRFMRLLPNKLYFATVRRATGA